MAMWRARDELLGRKHGVIVTESCETIVFIDVARDEKQQMRDDVSEVLSDQKSCFKHRTGER
jgi:hypothetical protein